MRWLLESANCFLKKGVVYVPTVAKLQTGAYTDIEPVAVVPVSNTGILTSRIPGCNRQEERYRA